MFCSITTKVSFHPVLEFDEIKRFEATHDMTRWQKFESTFSITFVNEADYVYSLKGMSET